MAQSGRFALACRLLTHLAEREGAPETSQALAAALGTSPVVVRRLFAALAAAELVTLRRGPQGGVSLARPARAVGLGEVYRAVEPDWLLSGHAELDAGLKRTRRAALDAMNETSLADLARRARKSAKAGAPADDAPKAEAAEKESRRGSSASR